MRGITAFGRTGASTACASLVTMKEQHPAESPRPKYSGVQKLTAGALAHWQVLAAGVLLGTGVAGLAATHDSYCGMTDLGYAPVEVRDSLRSAADEAGFRPGVLAAQLETESHWRSGVSSHAGAQGLAQFTPDTWDRWGNGGDINDPHDSIAAQGRYLAYLKNRLKPLAHGDETRLMQLTLAGYNAGPGAVEKYKDVPPFGETQNYVRKITKLSDTKYKVTCNPEPGFRTERLSTPES